MLGRNRVTAWRGLLLSLEGGALPTDELAPTRRMIRRHLGLIDTLGFGTQTPKKTMALATNDPEPTRAHESPKTPPAAGRSEDRICRHCQQPLPHDQPTRYRCFKRRLGRRGGTNRWRNWSLDQRRTHIEKMNRARRRSGGRRAFATLPEPQQAQLVRALGQTRAEEWAWEHRPR